MADDARLKARAQEWHKMKPHERRELASDIADWMQRKERSDPFVAQRTYSHIIGGVYEPRHYFEQF